MNEITLSQGTIRYRDVGSGPTVVFVHGLLVTGELWRKVVVPLSEVCRCVVPDLPLGSHSIPMNRDTDLTPPGIARIVADFIDALDLDDVTLVGNDSGGAICQLVAARHPERLGRLVLTTCDAFEVFPPPEFEYVRWVGRIPGAMWAMARAMMYSARLRRLKRAYGDLARRPLPDELTRRYVVPAATNRAVRRDLVKFTTSISPKYTMAVADELRAFDKPVLLLWTPEDRYFGIELAERLAERLPDARIETIDDAQVFVAEDQPERVAESLARFIGAGAKRSQLRSA
jgi:pimeloyl-ACP methyl ester carboxylesterase